MSRLTETTTAEARDIGHDAAHWFQSFELDEQEINFAVRYVGISVAAGQTDPVIRAIGREMSEQQLVRAFCAGAAVLLKMNEGIREHLQVAPVVRKDIQAEGVSP